MNHSEAPLPEPWLRGTMTEAPAVSRGVLHALELAREDARKWCGGLSDSQLHARPASLPSVAFHLRHIAGSIDRLLTYAEGRALSSEQLQSLKTETRPEGSTLEVLAELESGIAQGSVRVRALGSQDHEVLRTVGKQQLPTTLGGLLVHIADHTQRHAGQAITTAKLVSTSKVF